MAAIYTPQWIIDLHLTTTLYPVDVTESIAVSCTPVDETGWWPIMFEEGAGSMTMLSAALNIVRFDAPEQGPESGAGNMTLISAAIDIVRFDAPLQGPEEGAGNMTLISAALEHVVVDADSPDEMLEITCAPTTDSTMTPA